MSGHDHLLLHSGRKDQPGTYSAIFAERPPARVILFQPKGSENIPIGLEKAVEDHGAELFVREVESLDIPATWVADELRMKPHRVFINMFESLTEVGIRPEQVVVTVFSGTRLHASILLTLGMILDAEILVLSGKGEEQEVTPQPWMKGILHEKKPNKLQAGVLLGMLEAKHLEHGQIDSPNRVWLEPETIVGTQAEGAAPDPLGFSSTANTMIDEKLLKKSKAGQMQYRLTGRGWLAALSLWNQIHEEDKDVPYKEGRIMPVRAWLTEGELNAVGILNTLSRVDVWITLFCQLRDEEARGFDIHDSQPNSDTLPEDNGVIFNSAREIWEVSLAQQHTTQSSWALFDADQNTEESLAELCEWLWPRLGPYVPIRGTASRVSWTMDLTQFPNPQLLPAVLFGQALGLPMTYCESPGNHDGARGETVPLSALPLSSHILSMPNRDLLHALRANVDTELRVKHRILLALLHQRRACAAVRKQALSMLDEDPFAALPADIEDLSEGMTYADLCSLIAGMIDNDGLSESLRLPEKANVHARKYLRSAGLISIEIREGRAGAHELSLTPLGVLVALSLETQMNLDDGGGY